MLVARFNVSMALSRLAVLLLLLLTATTRAGEIESRNVYWVGHSLVSAVDPFEPGGNLSLIENVRALAESSGRRYDAHKHTTPGAPLGWNWGVADSYAGIRELIQPLVNEEHPKYGSFDAMVVTEGVDITSSAEWWASSFYARRFFVAARRANPDCRLYLYESWHHYFGSDDNFRRQYGPMETFDFMSYQKQVAPVWRKIAEDAADPARTATVDGYVYQGPGDDPGESDERLDIRVIPTGTVLVKVLERLAERRPGDDWSYGSAARGQTLSPIDFFSNPYVDFPADRETLAHRKADLLPGFEWAGGDVLDDIHPSHLLIHLNALVHFAVLYEADPRDTKPANAVPANLHRLFAEIVHQSVNEAVATRNAAAESDRP